MSRIESSMKNMFFTLIGQILGVLASFITRLVFVKVFSSEYLGLNSLFANILTVLSFTELGFGTAITYSLYKPLAKQDKERIKVLMNLFKKIYITVGIIIFVLGSSLTQFLPFFINEMPNIDNIKIIYLLFVCNTALSYFFSYKRTLIIADQNKYIATIYRYSCFIIMNIVQIIYLLISNNYITYLIIQILFTLIENILVSIRANKMYPYLKEKNIEKIDIETKKEITKNTKAMMMHKFGEIVVNSTDNIIISKYIGLIIAGMYSNYLLVIQALELITGQIYSSVLASIGNLCVSEKKEKTYEVFKNLNFITFCVFSFTSICCLCLFTPFIEISFGKQYVFSISVTLSIVVVYYLKGMRKSVLIFREAMGIFYQDRYKPIIESIVNLIVSIILVQKIGVAGIFVGTIISLIFVCIWLETFILFKYGFEIKVSNYFKDYLKYAMFTILLGGFTYYLCSLVNLPNIILSLIIKFMICVIIPNIMIILVFYKTEEFKYFCNLTKEIFGKIFKKELKNY